jgi:hypothetical protein
MGLSSITLGVVSRLPVLITFYAIVIAMMNIAWLVVMLRGLPIMTVVIRLIRQRRENQDCREQ